MINQGLDTSILRLMQMFGGGQQGPQQYSPPTPPQPLPTPVPVSQMPSPQMPQPQMPMQQQQPMQPQQPMYPDKVDSMAPPPDNTMQVLRQLFEQFKPETEASDAFSQHIKQMPERHQYPPSKLRQIGATLAGLGGGGPQGIWEGQPIGYRGNAKESFELSRGIRDEPFNRALGDWSIKNKPLQDAAINEKNINAGNRQMMLGETSRILQNDRNDAYFQSVMDRGRNIDSQVDRRAAQTEIDKGKLSLAEARNEAYIWRNKHTDWRMVAIPGGKVTFFNPKDPTQSYETQFESGKMTEEDRINLQGENRKDVAVITGDQAAQRAERAAARAKELEAIRARNREKLKKIPSGGSNKPEEPSAKHRRELNNAERVKSDPQLGKHVTINNGVIRITPPKATDAGRFRAGPDQHEWDEINRRIYGAHKDTELPNEKPPELESEVLPPDPDDIPALPDNTGDNEPLKDTPIAKGPAKPAANDNESLAVKNARRMKATPLEANQVYIANDKGEVIGVMDRKDVVRLPPGHKVVQ